MSDHSSEGSSPGDRSSSSDRIGRRMRARLRGSEPEPPPPLAVVGSEVSADEQMFGRAFDGRVVRRFMAYVAPYRRQLLVALAAVLVFTLTQMALPLIIRAAIDDGLLAAQASRRVLGVAGIVFGVMIAINFAANWLQEWIAQIVAERVLFDLRRAMFFHLQFVALAFMDRTEVGRLMSRLQGDVASLQEFLESTVFAIGDVVLLLGIIAILIVLHWQLGLLVMAIVPVLLIVRALWLPPARRAFLRARETSSIANGALAESINGVRLIQEMGREKVNFDLYDEKAFANFASHVRSSQFSAMMIPIVDTLSGIAIAAIVVVGGASVIGASLELGVLIAFIFYVQRFFAPIRAVTIQYSIMQRAMASGQRIFEVMDVPFQIEDRPNAADPESIEPTIRFDGVTFGYLPNEPVLHDISFEVGTGETVALVGPTGSGKTSITALLHRFYDVDAGTVYVGGRDVREVTQRSLGRHIGMVLQEPFLFTGTIEENIRYAAEGVGREEIERAAAIVGAHDFIARLPAGYRTVLEQRGSNLSLGQRQLISFARAIVADTRILILDEATANVDSYTELEIQRALQRLLVGRTALVIAHRLATVRNADRILVLQEGRIVERGSHKELVTADSLYASLYSMHYASFDDMGGELDRGRGA